MPITRVVTTETTREEVDLETNGVYLLSIRKPGWELLLL